MRNRTGLVLAAALLLVVPALVGAQEDAPPPGAPAVPEFRGPSGNPIPRGSVEVVQAGPGATITPGGAGTLDLRGLVGTTIDAVDGAVFSGPCEMAAFGGASFYVPEGCVAVTSLGPNRFVTLTAVQGTVYSKNPAVTLYVAQGGSITASPSGDFVGFRGEGQAKEARGPWVSFRGWGAMEELQRALEERSIFVDLTSSSPAGGPVSPYLTVR